MTTIARNFSAKCGEIDLVMRDRDHVAFIEVRYRGRSRFGNAASSVTLKKQQKIEFLREKSRKNEKPLSRIARELKF